MKYSYKMIGLLLCFCIVSYTAIAISVPFSDISNSAYKTPIVWLQEKGVVNGYEDGTYQPDKNISRSEYLKIAISLKYTELPDLTGDNNCFPDISGHWANTIVCIAKEKGWMTGRHDGKVYPNDHISYAEALAILVRIFEIDVSKYSTHPWYRPADEYFNEHNILPNGYTGEFLNFEKVSRGEMANIMYLLFKNTDIGTEFGFQDVPEHIINTTPTPNPEITKSTEEVLKEEVLQLVNIERKKTGAVDLVFQDQLNTAAQLFAEEMATKNFFSHTSPDGSTFSSRVQDTGYTFSALAENIAKGQNNADSVMQSWMSSSIHKKNILNSTYTQIGIGVAPLENQNGYVWVQVFGKPR